MNSEQQRKKEAATMMVGAILCGILAGLVTTGIFLWIYSFDIYRVAFSGRLRDLSLHFKYLFLVLSSLAWSLVFLKWIFRRNEVRS
jgi:hypothetical protein